MKSEDFGCSSIFFMVSSWYRVFKVSSYPHNKKSARYLEIILERVAWLEFLNKTSRLLPSTVLLLWLKMTSVVLTYCRPRELRTFLNTKLDMERIVKLSDKPHVWLECLHFHDGVILNITRRTFAEEGQEEAQVVLLRGLRQQSQVLRPGQRTVSVEIRAAFSIHH